MKFSDFLGFVSLILGLIYISLLKHVDDFEENSTVILLSYCQQFE